MILGPVSFLDCIVFLLFLAPNLLVNIGLWGTLTCAVKALPFLLIELPISFLNERYIKRSENQTPFLRKASAFEDIVIRCVRYAFANIPARIGRVFFSRKVALPFVRFRMLRYGYMESPIHWEEVSKDNVKGIWITHDPTTKPDFIIYYAHGGGFAMGSPYFYLEFLIALLTLLKSPSHPNPAIFALTYSLVPDAHYPTQVNEAVAGYKHILSLISNDSSKICLAGDSAGATILLSLLLLLSKPATRTFDRPRANHPTKSEKHLGIPALASFISPWTTIHSSLHKNTSADYLNPTSLNLYGSQYLNSPSSSSSSKPFPPPLSLADLPSSGMQILYSSTELFAPTIESFISTVRESYNLLQLPENESSEAGEKTGEEEKCKRGRREMINIVQETGGIHAWVIADLFLKTSRADRINGAKKMADWIGSHY